MKKTSILFAFTILMFSAFASDSVSHYMLVPQQLKLKTGRSITFQLLQYDASLRKYVYDVDHPVTVSKWLINGSVAVGAPESIYGKLEGNPAEDEVKYYAPKQIPKEKTVRISCEFMSGKEKDILFAYIDIEDFGNGFCIDPHAGKEDQRKTECFNLDRVDFKNVRENNMLDKVSQYKNLTPEQKLKIEELKGRPKLANSAADNHDWAKNSSTGTAVFNTTCNTVYISISDPDITGTGFKAFTLMIPGGTTGNYYTTYDKCIISCSGGKPDCGYITGPQTYISQYCTGPNGNCTDKIAIPAMIHIETFGKQGELITGYFIGQIGKAICQPTPEIHNIYGFFSVVRQPDVHAPCTQNK